LHRGRVTFYRSRMKYTRNMACLPGASRWEPNCHCRRIARSIRTSDLAKEV